MTNTAPQQIADNALDALRAYSTIVADSGDFEAIKSFEPVDATTNPTLVLKAAQAPANAPLLARARSFPATAGLTIVERLMLLFGRELTRVVARRVSTEVDARLSFDTAATVTKARALINGYAAMGIDANRILIKIAATWEGIRAAQVLEAEGIHCNMTLIFSPVQAQACFDAGVTLISPFVGRITDWYKNARGVDGFAVHEDPGVLSVRNIQALARDCHYPTEVMAASFRHTDQILALAGIDLMTIAPALLGELAALDPVGVAPHIADGVTRQQRIPRDRTAFAWAMNSDAMASDRLGDGIRRFTADQAQLEVWLEQFDR